jgi:hypothetical protein
MRDFQIPSAGEQREFLLRLYFGSGSALARCVDRAYLDFSRTLHGIGKVEGAKALRADAGNHVVSWLERLASSVTEANTTAFDALHRQASEQLRELYADGGYSAFSVGQAQKWLNMALKYVFVFGEGRAPGFAGFYNFGHVPLDSIMLNRFKPFGAPTLSCGEAWSRLDSYEEYLAYQGWIRRQFRGYAPLAVEFHLWGS